jgi:hypothetical protein
MAICKFCGIPFSSVSSVCDHLELYHDDSHDTCPGIKFSKNKKRILK